MRGRLHADGLPWSAGIATHLPAVPFSFNNSDEVMTVASSMTTNGRDVVQQQIEKPDDEECL